MAPHRARPIFFGVSSFVAILALSSPATASDDHLLLSEVVLAPSAGEFIEIFNPTSQSVLLDNYYLTDDADYALLPGAFGAGPAPTIDSVDFIARFPAGASIAPLSTLVVAIDGSGFRTTYSFAADFEIRRTDASTPDMVATNVGVSAGMTNGGESVTLFNWDGTSDRVTDIDMANIGAPSTENQIANKTGISVDGPDADTTPTTYAADNHMMPLQSGAPSAGNSSKRIRLETTDEITGSGNGLTGDDETSENISNTWDQVYSSANPGVANVAADLAITCSNDQTSSVPGQAVTYTIQVSNAGPATIQGAVVQNIFPAEYAAITWTSATTGGAVASTSGSGDIDDVVRLPVAATIVYTASATLSQHARGTVVNTATVQPPPNQLEINPADNSASDSDVLTPQADLSITKTNGRQGVAPGEQIVYTIEVINNGPSSAIAATISDLFPQELSAVAWSSHTSTGASATPSGTGDINDTITVPALGSIKYVATSTVSHSAAGQLSNTAQVSAPAGTSDPQQQNNSATDSDAVTLVADLSLSMVANPSSLDIGQQVVLQLVLQNSGPSAATGVVVANPLQAGISYIGSSASSGVYEPATDEWTVAVLPTDQSETLEVTVEITASGQLSHSAQVSSSQVLDPDSLPGNSIQSEDDQDGVQLTVASVAVAVAIAPLGSGWVTGTGLHCPETCQVHLPPSTQLHLLAQPRPGFTFSAWQGDCTGSQASISVTASSDLSCTALFEDINEPPLAGDDSLLLDEGGMATQLQSGANSLLANDSDPESGNLVLVTTPAVAPQQGEVTFHSNGTFLYRHNGSETTEDSLTYQVCEDTAQPLCATAQLTISITPVNDPPLFIDPTPSTDLAVDPEQSLTFVVAASDAESDSITYSVQGLPQTARLNATSGQFSWTPVAAEIGIYPIVLLASDGTDSSSRDLTITVIGLDLDQDGLTDHLEEALGLDTTSKDSDQDNISDGEEIGDLRNPRDSDLDLTIDPLDNDSDDDGVPDIVEAGDEDLDTAAVDSDDDGTADYLDLDSDDDEVIDETDNCRIDANPGQDNLDGDSLGDVCDPDIDGDNISNEGELSLQLDPENPDSDGDNISDGEEVGDTTGRVDSDNDDTIDALDPDSDNDGVDDIDEAGDSDLTTPAVNSDVDSLPDYLDPDSDNDGHNDGEDNCRIAANPLQEDSNNDGVGDICDGDIDGDSVDNAQDNCPLVANPQQENNDNDSAGDACDSDDDNDGVEDAEDNCPLTTNTNQANDDDDTMGNLCDADDDGDNVDDLDDNCPLFANPGQEDLDSDGLGDICDVDDDGDGIFDVKDNCPRLANTNQLDEDDNGTGDLCEGNKDEPESCGCISARSGTTVGLAVPFVVLAAVLIRRRAWARF